MTLRISKEPDMCVTKIIIFSVVKCLRTSVQKRELIYVLAV